MTVDKQSPSVIQNYYIPKKNNQKKIDTTVTVDASKLKLTLDVYILSNSC